VSEIMEEKLKGQQKPRGWPESEPFPPTDLEQTRKIFQEGEKILEETLEDLKKKIGGPTPEMLNTIINI